MTFVYLSAFGSRSHRSLVGDHADSISADLMRFVSPSDARNQSDCKGKKVKLTADLYPDALTATGKSGRLPLPVPRPSF